MRRSAAFLLALILLVGGVAALLGGASASDPMISERYVRDAYIPDTVKQAAGRIDTATGKTYDAVAVRLKAQAELHLARADALTGGSGQTLVFTEGRFKRGDVLTLDTGSSLMLLAGDAAVHYERGAVVDVTDGKTVASATALTARHSYLAAEDTTCRITVTSDTAVLAPQGYCTLTPSGETDYNQLAVALRTMDIFRGTSTAYGEGYDLELTVTRIEGLILFLRLLGEEQVALSYTGDCPFTDVPDWAMPYATYAYYKGYVKGVDEEQTLFDSYRVMGAGEYQTLVLRALGYRDSGDMPDFTWDTALARAVDLGCVTAGERTMLESKPFLRAQMAYLSYYALSANRKAGGTLEGHLISNGALNAAKAEAARAQVTVQRIA